MARREEHGEPRNVPERHDLTAAERGGEAPEVDHVALYRARPERAGWGLRVERVGVAPPFHPARDVGLKGGREAVERQSVRLGPERRAKDGLRPAGHCP